MPSGLPALRILVALLATSFLAACLAAPAFAHDGVADGDGPAPVLLGPPAPLDAGPGTLAANDRLATAVDAATERQAQAAFTEQLLGAPLEVGGSCDETDHFAGIGDGCLTEDGLLRVELPGGGSTTTHGPDFVSADGDADPSTLPPDMVAAIRGATVNDVVCVAPTTRHVHLVYAIPADGIDRFAAQAASFRQSLYEMSAVVNAESRSVDPTAGRKLRVDCNGSNVPNIDFYRLPTRSTSDTFGTVKADLAAKTGETNLEGRTHYLVFYDEQLDDFFAGIADMYPDGRAGASNDNNMGGLVAVQDGGNGVGPSWEVMLHEASHNMGAVADGAPDSNEVGHCNDGLDVMCYSEPGTPGVFGTYTETTCSLQRYDCDKDTYFNPSPGPTDWLATHWNIAASANGFIDQVAATNDTTAPAAPASLTGVGHGTFVRLTWPASSAGDVNAYRAYLKVGGVWTPITDSQPGSLTVDAGDDGAGWIRLDPNTSYDFGITAYDARGNESTMTTALGVSTGNFTTEEPTYTGTAPPAPVDVAVTGRTSSSLTFAWKHGVGGGDYAIVAYVFASGVWQPVQYTTSSTISVGGLSPNANSTIRFRTRSQDGRVSSPVDVTGSTLTPADGTPPVAPTSVTVTGSVGLAPTVSWTSVSDAAHYLVYRDGVLAETVTGTSAVVRGIAYGATPVIGVKAVDAAGNASAATTTTGFTASAAPDTTPPSAPPGISFSRTVTTLTINWSTPGSDNVGVTGYRVLYALPTVQDFVVGATTGPGATTATITGLTPNTAYRIKLQALDLAEYQSSPSSYYDGLSTLADTVAPSQPGVATASNIGQTTADLSWGASTDNAGVVGYRVYRILPTASGSPVATPAGTSTSLTGLTSGTSYTFEIAAVDSTGNESAHRSVSFTTTTIPDTTAPSDPTSFTVGTLTGVSASVSWGASSDNVGVTEYRMYRNGTQVASLAGTATSYTFSGLANLQTYTLGVRAYDAAGNFSTLVTTIASTPDTTLPSTPPAPTVGVRSSSSIAVSWPASTDNSGGTITYTLLLDGAQVGTTTSTSYTFTGLGEATSHTLGVKATDPSLNSSGIGSVVASTLDVTAPSQPVLVVGTRTGTSIAISWSGSADNVAVSGYRVYLNGSLVTSLGAGVATYTFGPLPDSTNYTVGVEAFDGASPANTSTRANAATSTLDTTAPTIPGTIVPSNIGETTLTLTWGASNDLRGVTSYRVYRDSLLVGTVTAPTTTLDLTGLAASHAYLFEVDALDAAGNVSAKRSVSATTDDFTAPTSPSNLNFTAIDGVSATLTWDLSNDNVGVSGYRVLVDGNPVTTLGPATQSFQFTGLTPAHSYTLGVEAYDARNNTSSRATAGIVTVDTLPPSAPGAITTSSLTETGVTLDWGASSDNVLVTGYQVFQGGTLLATVDGSTTTYAVSNLAAGTTYTFSVRAIDARPNQSPPTSKAVSTPDVTAPTQPGTLLPGAMTGNDLTVTWGASIDNVGVTAYRLYQGAVLVDTVTAPATSGSFPGLADSTSYTFSVSAIDAHGNESALRSVTYVTADVTAPTTPGLFAASGVTETNATFTWTASTDTSGAISGYHLYQDGTLVDTLGAAALTATRTDLHAGTSYHFTIDAFDATGNASTAAAVDVATLDLTAPTTPGAFTAGTPTGHTVPVSWTAASDNVAVTGYKVRADGGASTTLPATDRSYTFTGLSDGVTHSLSITAIDLAGHESVAATTSATTLDVTKPSQPGSFLAGTAVGTDVTATWTASTDNSGAISGYRVYRGNVLVGTLASSATSYTFGGLGQGLGFALHVSAFDAAGNESTLATATVTIPDTTPPGPIAALTVVLDEASGTVTATWPLATDNVGVAGFHVSLDGVPRADQTDARIVLAGLARSSSHVLTVAAFDAAGLTGVAASTTFTVPSEPIVRTPPPAPTAPSVPLDLRVTATSTTLAMSWAAPASADATGYHVVLTSTSGGTPLVQDVTATSITFAKLAPKSSFTVSVAARNAVGVGTAASTATSTLADTKPPTAPIRPRATSPRAGQLKVTWAASKDDVKLLRYEIKLTTKGAKPLTVKVNAPALATTVKKLRARASYQLQIRAVDAAGNGSAWVRFSAKTK